VVISPRDVIEVFKAAGKELLYHQIDLVSDLILKDKPKVLIADDVGLGKTIQALAYVKLVLEAGTVSKVLIIVPTSVLDQWLDEMRSFGIDEDLIYVVETPKIHAGRHVYIVTMDRAKKDEYLDVLESIDWDLVVVDEAHKIRFRTLRVRLSSLINRARRCLLLTATPHTGDEQSFKFLKSLVSDIVVRREKKDVESYEGRRILPRLSYWIVKVRASNEESTALSNVLKKLKNMEVEPIVRYTVLRRALSSPLSFLATLNKVAGGFCSEEELDEIELDSCLARISDKLEDVKTVVSDDRKLEVLKGLLNGELKGRKPIIFTEYATTAEYLFDKLVKAFRCSVIREGEGFGVAECNGRALMYVTAKARSNIRINEEVRQFSLRDGAILISTDVFSEGVNLQAFDVVVNYEVVWSPTKHIQRIGRAWRFGQKAEEVSVIDVALDVGYKESEFAMYTNYLEKIYEVSLYALTPHTYADYVVYSSSGSELSKLFELSGVHLSSFEVFEAVYEGKLNELRKKLEKLIELKDRVRRAKASKDVWRDVWLKLGYRRVATGKVLEPGSSYILANIIVRLEENNVFREQVLIDLPQVKDRINKAVVYRQIEFEGARLKGLSGEISADEADDVRKVLAKEFVEDLKLYIQRLNAGHVRPFIVIEDLRGVLVDKVLPVDDFMLALNKELDFSNRRREVEETAVKCIKNYLMSEGFEIYEDYYGGPRAFDMVVSKGRELYTVECKGRRIRPGEQVAITLTVNEMEWGLRFPERHLICIVETSSKDFCDVIECMKFEDFLKKWELRRQRSYYDYIVEAIKKQNI